MKSTKLEVKCCKCRKLLATMERGIYGQVELVCPSCGEVTYRVRRDIPWSEVWRKNPRG